MLVGFEGVYDVDEGEEEVVLEYLHVQSTRGAVLGPRTFRPTPAVARTDRSIVTRFLNCTREVKDWPIEILKERLKPAASPTLLPVYSELECGFTIFMVL